MHKGLHSGAIKRWRTQQRAAFKVTPAESTFLRPELSSRRQMPRRINCTLPPVPRPAVPLMKESPQAGPQKILFVVAVPRCERLCLRVFFPSAAHKSFLLHLAFAARGRFIRGRCRWWGWSGERNQKETRKKVEKVFYKKEEAGLKKGGMNKEERHNSQRGDWSLVAAPVPNAFHYLW